MGMRYNKPVQPKPRPDKQTEIQKLAYEQKADQRQSLKNSLTKKPAQFRSWKQRPSKR